MKLFWIFDEKRSLNMKVEIFLGVLLAITCTCQSTNLIVNVVELLHTDNYTFVCNLSPPTNLTRWTYISGSTGTSLMSYQNGQCTVSPSDSFLSDSSRYSYTCNSTSYLVTVKPYQERTNTILACKDAYLLNNTGSNWIIKRNEVKCSYCQPTITFDVIEVTEGDNATFVCRVPSNVSYVNWNVNFGLIAAMNVSKNGTCGTASGDTFIDNESKYMYTCNQTVYQVTIFDVSRSEHNDIYTCTSFNQSEGTGSNWIIKVVKAQVSSVTITTPPAYKVNANESTVVEFTCTASTARPAASVYWYRHPHGKDHDETQITDNITTTTDYNDLSVTTSILRLFVTRQYNDTKILCKANNTVNTTELITKVRRLLNITYAADDPYIVNGSEYRVIENTPGNLFCSAKDGNPSPTLSLSCNNFSPAKQSTINSNGNVTTTLTWNVSRTHDGTCTCTSQQTSFTNKTVDVSVVVLYPPSKPSFKANGINVNDDISMVEGKLGNITCMTEAKPLSTYTWIGPIIEGSINIQTLTFDVVSQNRTGQYNCTVNNTMDRSIGDSIAGINSAVVNVIVLYPPVVTKMNNISKFEGEELNKTCPFTVGLPNKTAIKWIKDYNKSEWNDAELHILYLEKNDTGLYTCNASNVMNPSADNNSYTGHDAKSFYLDVLYEAKINSFIIEELGDINVTVDENDTVNFICNADSNPTAVMTLRRESKILMIETSNNVEYEIVNASCLDAGTYYCSAKNIRYGENASTDNVQLFVNCAPRAAKNVNRNITSAKNVPITITATVIAYPPPEFKWSQLMNRTWTSLNYSDNFSINSSADQSNLTILNVSMEDFTNYEVKVTNEFGNFSQVYTLSPYGVPDTPTELRQIQSHTTTSSIHIEWKPGFNGGPNQTFYIKYKKNSDTTWTYFTVIDSGEETMDISLTGLAEDTQYDIVIFASNIIGNSTESALVASTKATPTYLGPLVGGIAGGVAGCIIIVVVIIVIIRRYKFSDGLVDNPMYVSSGSVVRVASSSFEFNAGLVRPNDTDMDGCHDIYAEVKKTKKKDATINGYEFVDINTDNRENSVTKQLPLVKAATNESNMPNINKDGLNYADLVFKDSQQSMKKGMKDHDPTPYELVDFSKKAEPLPDSDDDGDHKNTYWNV